MNATFHVWRFSCINNDNITDSSLSLEADGSLVCQEILRLL
jgi:hypothetical protein